MPERIATFPWGYMNTFDDNEIEIVSTISDPPKVRLAIEDGRIESNLGAMSFNIKRQDGRHEEYAIVMGRLRADNRNAGALYIGVRGPDNQSCKEVLYIDNNQAIFRVPVISPNNNNSDGTVAMSENGKYWIVQQNDGNLCKYELRVPFDKSTGINPRVL